MNVPCPTCNGRGSLHPLCKGPKVCKQQRFDGRRRKVCAHVHDKACHTCHGRYLIDDNVWYGRRR